MGLFSSLLGKGKRSEDKRTQKIFLAEQDQKMEDATREAQKTFRFFWRELYWEHRRIIPALGFAMVKVPFRQEVSGRRDPVVEHMWINHIGFDGDLITGELVNEPHQLTNVEVGAKVSLEIREITDWMFSMQGKTYGGFTIHALRSGMSERERKKHDEAWGVDFGDYEEILVAYQQKETPENLIEHPMSKNMAEKYREFFGENPDEIHQKDHNGHTPLHTETIAGNRTSVEVLLELGSDKTLTSNSGKTPLQYAEFMNWEHLLEVLT